MLERLSEIDWGRLWHAYGPATDTPDDIRALLANDPRRRESAANSLWSSICHQGTIYPASAAAVPFLLELLRSPSTPNKRSILTLIEGLCQVWHPWVDTEGFDPTSVADPTEDPYAGLDPERDDHEGEPGEEEDEGSYWRVCIAAHLAGRHGIPDYLALLGDPDPDVRAAAAGVLAVFPEASYEADPLFRDLLESETDDRRQAMFIDLLARVWVAPPSEYTWGRTTVRPLPPPTIDYLIAEWVLPAGRAAYPRRQAAAWVVASGFPEYLPTLCEAAAGYTFRESDQWQPGYVRPEWIFEWLLADRPGEQLRYLLALSGVTKGFERDRVVGAAQQLIIRLGDQGPAATAHVGHICPLLGPEYPELRGYAARALWRIDQDSEPLVPVLIAELAVPDPNRRWPAATTLADMGPAAAAAIPELRRVLDENDRLTGRSDPEAVRLRMFPREREEMGEALRRLEAAVRLDTAGGGG